MAFKGQGMKRIFRIAVFRTGNRLENFISYRQYLIREALSVLSDKLGHNIGPNIRNQFYNGPG